MNGNRAIDVLKIYLMKGKKGRRMARYYDIILDYYNKQIEKKKIKWKIKLSMSHNEYNNQTFYQSLKNLLQL